MGREGAEAGPASPPAGAADEATAEWEGRSTEELASRWGVPAVHAFRRIGSTSDLARSLAQRGAAGGTVVIASEQTAGRGRAGRAWSSPPGLGLWMSIIARPKGGTAAATIPLLVGLVAADALDRFVAPAQIQLKWPNDLVVGGRKLAGILCEGSWAEGSVGQVVVGFGLNVRHRTEDFPPELRQVATSLRRARGSEVWLREVADALVPRLAAAVIDPVWDQGARERYAARDALFGQAVTVTEPMSGAVQAHGIARGIHADGALLLEDPAGACRALYTGTVRLSSQQHDHS